MPLHPIDPIHADLVRYFEERESLALDVDDVAALRGSNAYVGIFWTHGLGYMRVVKAGKNEGGFRIPDAERYVPVRTEFELYGGTPQPGFCVETVSTTVGNEARQWHTIAGSVRIGDLLVVRWFPNNTSTAMISRGESEDVCWLEVWPQGNQQRRKVYLIDKWHGQADDRWRMCRRSENQ